MAETPRAPLADFPLMHKEAVHTCEPELPSPLDTAPRPLHTKNSLTVIGAYDANSNRWCVHAKSTTKQAGGNDPW